MTIPTSLRRLRRALVLAACTALPVAAQRGAPAPAAAPAPPPPPPLAYAPPAVIVSDGAFDVTLFTDASANVPEGNRRMADYFRACRRQLAIPAEDSSAVARSLPWDWTAGGTADPGTLTILVSRSTRSEVNCAVPDESRAFAYLRGYRVTSDTVYPYNAAITSITVVRDSQVIMPTDGERPALTRITQRGLVTVSGGLVRVSLPIDSILPDSLGEVSDLRIGIASPELALPHVVRIPWWALRPIWRQLLTARARALPGTRSADETAILLRPDPPGLDEPRRLDARVRLGTAFAEAGDVGAARVILGEAVAAEPCLTLAAAASPAAHEIVRQVRRRKARCTQNMPVTLARALAVPGFGHFDTVNRRAVSVATFVAVAATLAASQSTNDEAKRLYAQYVAYDNTAPGSASAGAATLYARAEDKRAFGSTLVVAGAALWGASVIEAAWTERRQQQRLARVQDVDIRSRRVGLAPYGAPGRVGVALTLAPRESSR